MLGLIKRTFHAGQLLDFGGIQVNWMGLFGLSGYGVYEGCAQRQYDSLKITDSIHNKTPTWSNQGLKKVNNSPAMPQAAMAGMTPTL
jgi:hypothetical protein